MATERMGDGGPAFPERAEDGTCYSGATLRDYFAAKAMAGMLGSDWIIAHTDVLADTTGFHRGDWIAEQAYAFADSMLAARSQP